MALGAWAASAQHPDPTWYHQDCSICHASHDAVATGTFPLERSTNDAACLSCHPDTTTTTTTTAAALASRAAFIARRSAGEGPGPAGGSPLGLHRKPGGAGFSHSARKEDGTLVRYKRVLTSGNRRITLQMGCMACHDPHGKQKSKLKALAFDPQGQLQPGVKPVYAAQVCFGCHAGPESAVMTKLEADVGSHFGQGRSGQGSSHEIGQSAADRPDLPSLRTGAFKGRLDCTSCHSNPDAGALKGPHASRFPSLLKADYARERDAPFSGGHPNDLCYTCHDQRSIESNRSFSMHREHIRGFTGGAPSGGSMPMGLRAVRDLQTIGRIRPAFQGLGEPTPCATCHDPHGSKKDPSLIAFDPAVVTRSSVGGPDFYRNGLGHGTCTLSCHGYDHIQTRY